MSSNWSLGHTVLEGWCKGSDLSVKYRHFSSIQEIQNRFSSMTDQADDVVLRKGWLIMRNKNASVVFFFFSFFFSSLDFCCSLMSLHLHATNIDNNPILKAHGSMCWSSVHHSALRTYLQVLRRIKKILFPRNTQVTRNPKKAAYCLLSLTLSLSL